jgi:hypothetical protein
MYESPMSADGLVSGVELAINVRDKEAARRWYADKMGIVFDADDQAYVSGVTLVLWGFSDSTPASHVAYQLITPNLAKVHALLVERGVSVTEISGQCWNFVACDPDGNKFVFYTPRKWLASGMAPFPEGFPPVPG